MFLSYLIQDFSANRDNIKGRIVLFLFRLGQVIYRNRVTRIIFFPYLIFYRLMIEWFLGMEIPWKIEAGKGLRVYHGQALVINPGTVIGANCTLRQSTTIGNKQSANGAFGEGKSPVIGNNVDVGSNVCIIGDIIVGNNVVIGAGTIVVKDVPDDSVIVGNPARIVRPRTDKLDQSI